MSSGNSRDCLVRGVAALFICFFGSITRVSALMRVRIMEFKMKKILAALLLSLSVVAAPASAFAHTTGKTHMHASCHHHHHHHHYH